MTQKNDIALYGKVVDGVLVEFPVYETQILGRGESLSNYIKAKVFAYGNVPQFSYPEQKVQVVNGNEIHITYEIKPQPLKELLVIGSTFAQPNANGNTYLVDIPVDLFNAIYTAIDGHVSDLLDAMARQRGYGFPDSPRSVPLKNLTSYANDYNFDPRTKAEGVYGFKMLFVVWSLALKKFEKMQHPTDPDPIPKTVAEIDAWYPPVKWDLDLDSYI